MKNIRFIAFVLAIFCSKFSVAPIKTDSCRFFLKFINTNKNKVALFITQNDTVVARLNEDKIMPLASTVKIMVAIEFAKQASAGVINEDEYVAITELDKYYLPNTDGDAHPTWLTYEKENKNIKNDSVKLLDIARGMIMFSSNANTEFLMDLLGFDNVKNNIQLLGLKKHTALYPLVSSLFMYQNPKAAKQEKIIKAIKKMSEEEYCKNIFAFIIN
ncbi:MAG: serine hydrolase [Chitinophagaceae bacterium]|nr:serine hydrolase [Chitinophagaceae bacterium]